MKHRKKIYLDQFHILTKPFIESLNIKSITIRFPVVSEDHKISSINEIEINQFSSLSSLYLYNNQYVELIKEIKSDQDAREMIKTGINKSSITDQIAGHCYLLRTSPTKLIEFFKLTFSLKEDELEELKLFSKSGKYWNNPVLNYASK